MPKAFVLISVEVAREKEVAQKLRELEGVSEVYEVYGSYDIIAVVEADSLEKLREIVFSRIRRTEGIRSTTTFVTAVT